MTENGWIRQICAHINRWEEVPCLFLPESRETDRGGEEVLSGKKLPVGAVCADAGPSLARVYVDGSGKGELPFVIRYHTVSGPAEGVEALELLEALSRYLADFAPDPDGIRVFGACRRTGLPVREEERNDGIAVYRMECILPWRHRTAGKL